MSSEVFRALCENPLPSLILKSDQGLRSSSKVKFKGQGQRSRSKVKVKVKGQGQILSENLIKSQILGWGQVQRSSQRSHGFNLILISKSTISPFCILSKNRQFSYFTPTFTQNQGFPEKKGLLSFWLCLKIHYKAKF